MDVVFRLEVSVGRPHDEHGRCTARRFAPWLSIRMIRCSRTHPLKTLYASILSGFAHRKTQQQTRTNQRKQQAFKDTQDAALQDVDSQGTNVISPMHDSLLYKCTDFQLRQSTRSAIPLRPIPRTTIPKMTSTLRPCPSCSRCQETGDACTYSKRRWHLPHLQPPRKKQQHLRQQPRGLARLHAAQVLQYRTSSATPEQNGMLSLKR